MLLTLKIRTKSRVHAVLRVVYLVLLLRLQMLRLGVVGMDGFEVQIDNVKVS